MIGTLTPAQVDDVLRGEVIGRIGCHAGGRTYVVPVTYAYADGCVYGHSAVGQKVEMMRENPDVCFEVEHVDALSRWKSVIAWGTYEELHGSDADRGMQALIERMMPLMAEEANRPTHGSGASHRPDGRVLEPVIFRIRLHQATGRFEGE